MGKKKQNTKEQVNYETNLIKNLQRHSKKIEPASNKKTLKPVKLNQRDTKRLMVKADRYLMFFSKAFESYMMFANDVSNVTNQMPTYYSSLDYDRVIGILNFLVKRIRKVYEDVRQARLQYQELDSFKEAKPISFSYDLLSELSDYLNKWEYYFTDLKRYKEDDLIKTYNKFLAEYDNLNDSMRDKSFDLELDLKASSIDGDYLEVEENTISDLIDGLNKQFDTWGLRRPKKK